MGWTRSASGWASRLRETGGHARFTEPGAGDTLRNLLAIEIQLILVVADARRIRNIVGGDPRVHFVRGALAPMCVECLKLDHLEVDIDADFLEALLKEFIHRQRKHLSGAALRDDECRFQRLVL